MLFALLSPLLITSDSGPLDVALNATQAPDTLRAAFVVEVRSGDDYRIYHFDPRLLDEDSWSLVSEAGENDELDDVGASWGAEAAPDSRLFPTDMRDSLSQQVEVDEFGDVWRVRFNHRPSLNDGELDIWAARHFEATAWLDSTSDRFLRIDHELPRPVTGPRGGRLLKYSQSHFMETDPEFNLSFISALSVELEARAGLRTVRRDYTARVLQIELFFASAADQNAFLTSSLGE